MPLTFAHHKKREQNVRTVILEKVDTSECQIRFFFGIVQFAVYSGQRILFSVFQVVPNTSIWLFVIQLKRVKRDQKRIESKIGFQNKTELVENGEQSNAFQLAVDVC